MYLLDTNVVSELRKVPLGTANPGVRAWADNEDADELFLSVLSIQELEVGVLLKERIDHLQGAVLRRWMDSYVLPAFAGRVIPIDTAIVLRSASLHVPHPRPIVDTLIAATALVHGMCVVTRNVADFAPTGVQTLNPWDDS
jgi:toxin FitB